MSCMMSNVGVEQRGRWEMEFSMGRRSICVFQRALGSQGRVWSRGGKVRLCSRGAKWSGAGSGAYTILADFRY